MAPNAEGLDRPGRVGDGGPVPGRTGLTEVFRMAPLQGLRVLDLTRLLPGPAASMHLADYGADVVKVEDLGEGDSLRSFEPLAADGQGRRVNPAYQALNRGKRSIRLDLKQPAGREAFLQLARQADAVLEGFRPGVMERLGLGWSVLHQANPRLVLLSLSGYGQDGPLALAAGHDLDYCAVSGILDQNRAGGRPAIPNLQPGDLLGGALTALSTLLIALLAAQRTGQGAHVDVAMADGLLAHHFFPHGDLDAGATPVAGATLLTGGVACYQIYRCADGLDLAVGALELKFWRIFCAAAGLPGLSERHWSLGEPPGSPAARQAIREVAARLGSRPRAEWEAVFAGLDACVMPVLTPAEALRHPQFAARGIVHRRQGVTLVAPLARMTGHDWEARAAPRGGQQTAEVLREAGFTSAQVEALLAAGAARQD
jgi:crotonobetainyl-CoA:carnitine CoA-transferase CaiB-like acyl-CoA transferase